MISLHFPTTLQAVLIRAAHAVGVRATSGTLAEGLDVNASFVRRLILPLERAGLVATGLEQTGGLAPSTARPLQSRSATSTRR